MSPALQLLAAAIGGGVVGQIVSALAARKKVGADAVHVITQASAVLVKSYQDSQARLEATVERAEEHALKAVADAFLARQAEDECKQRLGVLEEQVAELRIERLA